MELKHIAPYLPYGLKGIHDMPEYSILNQVVEVESLNEECITFKGLGFSDYYFNDNERENNFKPILRNLSDLTKPIEHNGERFVPIYKLWELAGFEIGRGQYITDEPNYIKTSNLGTAQEFRISKSDILSSNYNVIQKLIEWKYDIFNLIGKGEAIDVNTLQTNPYK